MAAATGRCSASYRMSSAAVGPFPAVLDRLGFFPLPAEKFRSTGTVSIAERKVVGLDTGIRLVMHTLGWTRAAEGPWNGLRMSVIPFVVRPTPGPSGFSSQVQDNL